MSPLSPGSLSAIVPLSPKRSLGDTFVASLDSVLHPTTTTTTTSPLCPSVHLSVEQGEEEAEPRVTSTPLLHSQHTLKTIMGAFGSPRAGGSVHFTRGLPGAEPSSKVIIWIVLAFRRTHFEIRSCGRERFALARLKVRGLMILLDPPLS
ncbi:unnamed protein product [Pleuronectes platessa]|uniref:Uncharacterized protein n=1 Tax=Pleuronectes platessa TaxID=8262 RepID=A0A9N7YY20_PLEPL|nr:unnamed protein product [Pleuronectes platessa]